MPPWLSGLILGVIAVLVALVRRVADQGTSARVRLGAATMLVVLVIHAIWGIGVGLIMQMRPRAYRSGPDRN